MTNYYYFYYYYHDRFHCPNSLFQIWELFLQQVEVNSQQHGDISRNFSQTIGNGLIERVFHRKIQSKKIFAHRDRIETILLKSNELLIKVNKQTTRASCVQLNLRCFFFLLHENRICHLLAVKITVDNNSSG